MGRICLEKTGLMLTGFEPDTDAYGNELQRPVYQEGYLAGGVFEVRAAETVAGKDGKVWFTQDALVSTLTTTAEGMAVSDPLPLGRYYLVETQAPAGYALDETRYDVTLATTDSQTALVDVQVKAGNAYIPVEITVEKQAETLQSTAQADGTLIRQVVDAPGEGFVFGLYNTFDIRYPGGMLPAGTLVATGATDAEGQLTFAGNYPHGDYEVRELQAPEGWKRSPERFPITLEPEGTEAGTVIRARGGSAQRADLHPGYPDQNGHHRRKHRSGRAHRGARRKRRSDLPGLYGRARRTAGYSCNSGAVYLPGSAGSGRLRPERSGDLLYRGRGGECPRQYPAAGRFHPGAAAKAVRGRTAHGRRDLCAAG